MTNTGGRRPAHRCRALIALGIAVALGGACDRDDPAPAKPTAAVAVDVARAFAAGDTAAIERRLSDEMAEDWDEERAEAELAGIHDRFGECAPRGEPKEAPRSTGGPPLTDGDGQVVADPETFDTYTAAMSCDEGTYDLRVAVDDDLRVRHVIAEKGGRPLY